MPSLSGYKTPLDATIYYRGIYYRRFVTIAPATRYLDGQIGYHTYPSTPGTTWESNREQRTLAHCGLGSERLTHTHTYRTF